MQLAFRERNCSLANLPDLLIRHLSGTAALSHAAAWALGWLNHGHHNEHQWQPDAQQLQQLVGMASQPVCDSEALCYLNWIFKNERCASAIDALLQHLPDVPDNTREAIIAALGAIGDAHATGALMEIVENSQEPTKIRNAAAAALGNIGGEEAIAVFGAYLQNVVEEQRRYVLGSLSRMCSDGVDRKLLFEDIDNGWFVLDPQSPISAKRINEAAEKLNQSPATIQQHYQQLAARFGIFPNSVWNTDAQ